MGNYSSKYPSCCKNYNMLGGSLPLSVFLVYFLLCSAHILPFSLCFYTHSIILSVLDGPHSCGGFTFLSQSVFTAEDTHILYVKCGMNLHLVGRACALTQTHALLRQQMGSSSLLSWVF